MSLNDRALILAPRGRDAALARAMLNEAGIEADISASLAALVDALGDEAGFALVTEETLRAADTAPLLAWRDRQPEWSDFPFILLTERGGLERNPAAARWLDLLGNVTFVERPFHPTTLVSLARAALRGRGRQYEARARIAAMAESELRYRNLFDTIDEGFCVIQFIDGPDGPLSDYVHVEANPAYERHAGIQEVVGKRLREIVGGEADEWAARYRDVLLTGNPIRFEQELEQTGRHLDLAAFRIEPPERLQVAVIFQDVTPRRAAEVALRELNATLEDRVDTALEERAKVEDTLRQSQKMEAIGQLTGGVAHDFNNLLTVIRSSADLLRRPNVNEERQRRYIDAIADTADRAAKLTQQLLAFSRRQALQPEVFDVGLSVDGIADMLRTVVGSRIALDVAHDDALRVRADPSQFETALVNLCVNARDAMKGEGRIAIRSFAGPCHDGEAPCVHVAIEDVGHGIAPDLIDRLFEPFFTTKDVGKGTGLGLSQVYGFAKQSGGDVAVRSEVGAGTVFTLILPQTDAPVAGVAPQFELSPDDVHGHILVVEDNPDVRSFAAQILSDIGYRISEASGADEAFGLLAPDPSHFDLVFTDVIMQGMSGVDLARRIRTCWPDLPVVLTSGYSDTLAESDGIEFPLLPKPYSSSQLMEVIGRARAQSAATA